MDITIIIPVYNESGNVRELIRRLDLVGSNYRDIRFHYLFVDDGSNDDTVERIQGLTGFGSQIRLLQLSRNFGKEAAVTAGIDHSGEDVDGVIIMDSDLQHPPEVIPELIEKWKEGFEIVATRRSLTKQPLIKKIGSHLFYGLFNRVADMKMISQTTDFRLLDRVVIEVIKKFTERNRIVRGIIDWTGFRRCIVEFESPDRFSGTASYSYLKLIRLAINTFTSFSLFPLKAAGYLGLVLMFTQGIALLYMIIDMIFTNTMNFSPMALVVMVNTFLIGIVLSSLGLIALYIGNIHTEVINRPLYIIRDSSKKKE